MKTTKKYFEQFKAEFLRLQKELGLMQYRVVFYHKKMPDDYASIDVDEKGKLASISLTTIIKEPNNDPGPESHARHEAIHLLIHRLRWLGGSRYITYDEMSEEVEAVVVRLEKVLD